MGKIKKAISQGTCTSCGKIFITSLGRMTKGGDFLRQDTPGKQLALWWWLFFPSGPPLTFMGAVMAERKAAAHGQLLQTNGFWCGAASMGLHFRKQAFYVANIGLERVSCKLAFMTPSYLWGLWGSHAAIFMWRIRLHSWSLGSVRGSAEITCPMMPIPNASPSF